MPQLFLILEEGNTALLTRALGDIQLPRFASQGLLSTIASWCMESAGHELRVIASANVRVLYRRFDNNLLFVLVTSNLLLQTELLQLHLETLYDVLLLLLGSGSLVLDTSAKISALKIKLKAPDILRAVDSLVADDTLAPCILLPVPQIAGLPMRDKAMLQSALTKVLSTLGCEHAAFISEGYYLAATPGWWTLLSPREQLLIQHLAAQQAQNYAEDSPPELLLHLEKRHYGSPLRLRLLRLYEAVLLAVVFESGSQAPPSLKDSEQVLRGLFQSADQTLETPLWLSPPVPQFATITFDMALLVRHSPPSAVLLWGHTGTSLQQGFNPLVSPSLRKQMGNSASPIAARIGSLRPVSLQREDSVATAGCGEGLQLFFRSTLDTLLSFVLQMWPQMHPGLQATLQSRRGMRSAAVASGGGGGDANGHTASLNASQPQQQGHQPPQPPPHQLQQHPQQQTLLSAQPGAASSAVPFGSKTPPPPASRLGWGPLRRPSSAKSSPRDTPSSSQGGGGGGRTPFWRRRGGSGSTEEGTTAPAPSAAEAAASPFGGEGALVPDEPVELAHSVYEEVHSIIEGARLLALLDARVGHEGAGLEDAVDVFMALPKRVGRAAALEAATTLRGIFLMSYHDDE